MRSELASRKTVRAVLPREVDFTNAEQLCAELCALATTGLDAVIADMTGTRFCDSTGFWMLLVVHDRLAEEAIQLEVAVSPDGPVMRALKLIGFDRILRLSLDGRIEGPESPENLAVPQAAPSGAQ